MGQKCVYPLLKIKILTARQFMKRKLYIWFGSGSGSRSESESDRPTDRRAGHGLIGQLLH